MFLTFDILFPNPSLTSNASSYLIYNSQFATFGYFPSFSLLKTFSQISRILLRVLFKTSKFVSSTFGSKHLTASLLKEISECFIPTYLYSA